MMRRRRIGRFWFVLPALLLLVVAGLFLKQIPGGHSTASISPDSYRLELEQELGNDQSQMELKAGDRLQVKINISEGSLGIEITGTDGTYLYRSSDAESAEFVLEVPKDDKYTIAWKARKATGSAEFTVMTEAE